MTQVITTFKEFNHNITILGAGSICVALLPLLKKHIKSNKITIISDDNRNWTITKQYDVERVIENISIDNYKSILQKYTSKGDIVINLTVDVSSKDLVEECQKNDVMYIDTCIQPWPGFFDNFDMDTRDRTNYSLREGMIKNKEISKNKATAVLSHGANPGLVNHLVKDALIDIAKKLNVNETPSSQTEWATLAMRIGLKVIHISERDSQFDLDKKKSDEFVNTWSVDGFIAEGILPAELGWGSHEPELPSNGVTHVYGSKAAIFLNNPGCATKVKSWAPNTKEFEGFLITHQESITLAEFLSVNVDNNNIYRPTVHYAYHPCDQAVESLNELTANNLKGQSQSRIMTDSIVGGMDELGVLLMGEFGSYWTGSQLSIDETRSLVENNNATSLQVVAPLCSAILWMIDNTHTGILEPDDLPYDFIIENSKPYLGKYVKEYSDWYPKSSTEKTWEFKHYLIKNKM